MLLEGFKKKKLKLCLILKIPEARAKFQRDNWANLQQPSGKFSASFQHPKCQWVPDFNLVTSLLSKAPPESHVIKPKHRRLKKKKPNSQQHHSHSKPCHSNTSFQSILRTHTQFSARIFTKIPNPSHLQNSERELNCKFLESIMCVFLCYIFPSA